MLISLSNYFNSGEHHSMKKILFFGNSLTAGYGLQHPQEQAFPSLILQKIKAEGLQYEIINAGVSGDTSASAKHRIDHLLKQHIDVFVLELGANDLLRGIPAHTTAINLQHIIDRVVSSYPAAKLVLLGMQLPEWIPGIRAAAFRELFQSLARKNDMAFVPFLLEGVAGIKELNMPDGLHPLAEGYEIIAAKVWPVVRSVL
jgi:acyl-CoA thioesterase-1